MYRLTFSSICLNPQSDKPYEYRGAMRFSNKQSSSSSQAFCCKKLHIYVCFLLEFEHVVDPDRSKLWQRERGGGGGKVYSYLRWTHINSNLWFQIKADRYGDGERKEEERGGQGEVLIRVQV